MGSPKPFRSSGGMNDELTVFFGNVPSLAENSTIFLKSNARVSKGPIICIPTKGSPSNGTDTSLISWSNKRTQV